MSLTAGRVRWALFAFAFFFLISSIEPGGTNGADFRIGLLVGGTLTLGFVWLTRRRR